MKEFTWKRFWSLPALVTIAIIVFDQWSKYIILNLETLKFGGRIEVIPSLFHIVYVRNPGAAWGILSNATSLLATISGVVFIVMLVYYTRLTNNFIERCIAISIMMGGIAGNFIDRAFRDSVIDFLSFTYKSFEWPAFNLADSAICIGVAIYSVSSLLRPDGMGTMPTPIRS